MMNLNLNKLSISANKQSRIIDPIELFGSLTLRGSIENLWNTQAQALQEWFKNNDKTDIVIEMMTGGGKTIVGLLIAQSMVNQFRKRVLYICPTNQLVEQVYTKAKECSIEVAAYKNGAWDSQEIYDRAIGPCITNYAAVFNGKSIFEREDITGVVFDDAHVAGNTIRSQFTITANSNEPSYAALLKLFMKYFTKNFQSQSFRDVQSGDPNTILFVPMFEMQRASTIISQLLIDNSVLTNNKTKFAWEHLKNKLDRCCLVISGKKAEIAPAILPLHQLAPFSNNVKRVYLTATLPTPVEFARSFGLRPPFVIKPKGKSGEAQRLFIYSISDNDLEHTAFTKKLINDRKAAIIVSSTKDANNWIDIGSVYDGKTGNIGIVNFAKSRKKEKLILVARYDGIDLPGDSCKILVLDGIPRGSQLLNRFLDERLKVESLRASHIAIRIVQAIGRIFRSNTDHGALILNGSELYRWTTQPANLSFLPELIQKQIQLGLELNRNVCDNNADYPTLLEAILSGDSEWDKIYQSNINNFDIETNKSKPNDWLIELIYSENHAFRKLWDGNFSEAAVIYANLYNNPKNIDDGLKAWYLHLKGLCHDLNEEYDFAQRAYVDAANIRSEFGRPKIREGLLESISANKIGSQVKQIASRYRSNILNEIEQIKSNLVYGPQTAPAEEAVANLGRLLGLTVSRPEKEEGTGPDVIWYYEPKHSGILFELKTNKNEQSQYRKKDDIGQLHDHLQYIENKFIDWKFIKVIIGRKLEVSQECNPPMDLRIIGIEEFYSLIDRVFTLYRSLNETAEKDKRELLIERWMDYLGLKWPFCFESMQSTLAIDLQYNRVEEEDIQN